MANEFFLDESTKAIMGKKKTEKVFNVFKAEAGGWIRVCKIYPSYSDWSNELFYIVSIYDFNQKIPSRNHGFDNIIDLEKHVESNLNVILTEDIKSILEAWMLALKMVVESDGSKKI